MGVPIVRNSTITSTTTTSNTEVIQKQEAKEQQYRVILKHDNDDDGEDGAGRRLAHLLEMRHDVNVLVLVSRWYGGVLLGPKRSAHITNVARELLVQTQH